MKKIGVVLAILTCTLWPNDQVLASAIFNRIIRAITAKRVPKVYLHRGNEALVYYPGRLQLVKRCDRAEVVVLSTLKGLPASCKGKILFGTRYMHLANPQVIGAFFWQKGRPNILFYRNRLKAREIDLGRDFDKYIEQEER